MTADTPAHSAPTPTPSPLSIAVIALSDTRTLDDDRSGALLEQRLREAGHRIVLREVWRESLEQVTRSLQALVDDPAIDVVIATGGTGITARDITPDAVAAVSTRDLPGFGELFRTLSYAEIGSSTIQSRACACLAGRTLVFALPGSTNACRLALDKILVEQLDVRHRPCNFVSLLPRV